ATSFTAASAITSQHTTVPVQATAFLAPSSNFGQSEFTCASLACVASVSPENLNARQGMLWDIDLPVALRWRFTTPDGRVLGDVSFPVAGFVPMTLAYTPNAGWSVSTPSASDTSSGGVTLSDLDCGTGA